MLTIDDLKKMPPDEIFATGITEIKNPWYGQANDWMGTPKEIRVKWVATRGGIWDWAIYHSWDFNLIVRYGEDHITSLPKQIQLYGAKLHDMEKVQELVPCDKEALEMYRH